MADDLEEGSGSLENVFRLVKVKKSFIPSGETLPTFRAFEPDQRDLDEARERGLPVRVSVWDVERTTFEEGCVFFATDEPKRAYSFSAKSLAKLAAEHRRDRVRLVRDPLVDDQRPGWDGHCAVEGLDRLPGENKKDRVRMLRDLASEVVLMASEEDLTSGVD